MPEMSFKPYISLVVAARNDGLSTNLLAMQAFFDAWLGQANRYTMESEIIVVEWDPPGNRPKLSEVLRWPAETNPCEIRFIEVPAEVHRRFKNAGTIPIHTLIAKNAGIRRARGEFVLATSPDIIFSAELMQLFAERRLEPRSLYRIDRHDVEGDVPAPATAEQLAAYCANHVRRVLAAEGEFELERDGLRKLDPHDVVSQDAGIHFGAGCCPVESDDAGRFRWLVNGAEIIVERPAGATSCLWFDVETGPSAGQAPVAVRFMDSSNCVLGAANLQGRARLRVHFPEQISSARLRLEIQSQGLSLARDPRRLDLRLGGLGWDQSASLAWKMNQPAAAGIRVRSVRPRQIQIELKPDTGSQINRLQATLSDPAGNTLFQMKADPLKMAPGSEYLLTLDLGFELSRDPVAVPFGQETADSGWVLELAETKSARDWSREFWAPSPHANEIRNAAHLHVNGCSDFTLLAREDWHALRGYAEFPIWPAHIDSLFCYAAHHAGIREVILREPLRIFQLGYLPGKAVELDALSDPPGVPSLSLEDVFQWINQMRRIDAPVIFNQGAWGLGDVELAETIVSHTGLKRST
jgi:hypothetical protein